jgi:tetratricopeptide (TPR) repeat protein
LILRASWIRAGAVVLAASASVAGCAARQSHFSQRFVKPGTPSVEMPMTAQPPIENSMHDFVRKVRELQAKAHPKSSSLLPTLESTDPVLSKTLLLLAMTDSADLHVVAADAYRKAGVTDYAFRHYQRAAALDPCSASAYDGMARIWRDWGRPDIAIGDSYRALYCRPQSSELHNTLGTIMSALGQAGNAADEYRRAIALDPHSAAALTNLGYLELQRGHVDEAIRLCSHAISAAPGFEPALNNLALAYVTKGDYTAAQRTLERGGNAVAAYNLGVLRLANGDFRLAAEAFDEAAELQPSMTIARARAVQARRAAEAGEQAKGTRDQR